MWLPCAAVATSNSVSDIGFKALGELHRLVLHLSGGKVGARAFGMEMVELHTVGRISGRPRTTMLGTPLVDGDQVVLVASKGGAAQDPDWFKNLVAHPDAELTVGGRRRPVRARVATAEERAELWPRVTAVYGGYAKYQRKTDREIPVVICEPR